MGASCGRRAWIGKTGLMDAAADAAAGADTRVVRGAGIEFEAGMSFSGLNQVLLPLPDEFPRLPRVHRNALNVALGFGEGVLRAGSSYLMRPAAPRDALESLPSGQLPRR